MHPLIAVAASGLLAAGSGVWAQVANPGGDALWADLGPWALMAASFGMLMWAVVTGRFGYMKYAEMIERGQEREEKLIAALASSHARELVHEEFMNKAVEALIDKGRREAAGG